MKQEDRLNIQAWLDGEISPQKATQISDLVEANPAAQAVAEELKAVECALKIGGKPVFLDETREFYWGQIERQINAEEPMPAAPEHPRLIPESTGSLMRWLIPVGSLAAICALMINFGNVNLADPVQPIIEETTPSTSGLTQPAGTLEEENNEAGVGVFSFEGGDGSRNLPNPEDPSALPESIENPER
jgi:anti-sigma factor RsiW